VRVSLAGLGQQAGELVGQRQVDWLVEQVLGHRQDELVHWQDGCRLPALRQIAELT